ncbi:MAG: beta-galactosidase [Kiritimatiellae bacterium]|nr:beta-galactosidase [Kiritimatiellia bacterium]
MAGEIDTRLRIGSHLYLRRDMSEADIFAAIEKMREIGMDIVRVYPYWADVETAPGEYDFTQVDACYRACEKFGIGVLHTFKLNAPPAWMNVTRSFNLDDFGDLDSPAFRDALRKFVVRSAERYTESPRRLWRGARGTSRGSQCRRNSRHTRLTPTATTSNGDMTEDLRT